jgi:hypothetical protein
MNGFGVDAVPLERFAAVRTQGQFLHLYEIERAAPCAGGGCAGGRVVAQPGHPSN